MKTLFNANTFKSFLIKLTVFFVIIFIIDKMAGYALRKYYFKQKSGYDYLTTYSIDSTKQDILVFGSSRAVNIFNTAIIEERTGKTCYNVGRYGEPIFYHDAVLKSVLKRYKPKFIILSVDAGGFSINEEAYDRISVLLPYYKHHPEIRDIVHMRGRFEPIKMLSDIYPFNSLLLPMVSGNSENNKWKYPNINGFIPLEKVFTGPLKTYEYYKEKKLDDRKIKVYEDFINDCKTAGVPLYVVCPPYQVNAIGTDSSITVSKQLAVKYQVPFFDYTKDSFYTSRQALFADYRHLNQSGVKIFTNAVMDTLKNHIK